MRPALSKFALAGSLLMMNSAALEPARWTLLMQSTRTAPWIAVPRFTVAQGYSRHVRIAGPWMDYISSVTPIAGITGRNVQHINGQTDLILDASSSTSRGDHSVQVKITCPPLAYLNGCAPAVVIPVKVLEMGPVNRISPSGTVPPNTTMVFRLEGEGLNVAKILARLTTLQNAAVLPGATSTALSVRGTTKACGYVDISLSDVADGDEFPYKKNYNTPILAGTLCAGSLPPTPYSAVSCPSGKTYDPVSKTCYEE
jgi:hypothetical protein